MPSKIDTASDEMLRSLSVDTDSPAFSSFPVSFPDTEQREDLMSSVTSLFVQTLTHNSDEELTPEQKEFIRDWLQTQARFPKYSWRNTVLIQSQQPSATYIQSPDTWNEAGASIRRGESAIWIWEPITGKACPKCGNTANYHKSGKVDCQNHLAGSPEYWPEGVVGTRPSAYFDQSQVQSFTGLPQKYSIPLSSLSAAVVEQLVERLVDADEYELSTVKPYEASFDGGGEITRDVMTFKPTITVKDSRPGIRSRVLIKYHLLSAHYDEKGEPAARHRLVMECVAKAIAMVLDLTPPDRTHQLATLGNTESEVESSLTRISNLVESYLRRLRNAAHSRKEQF